MARRDATLRVIKFSYQMVSTKVWLKSRNTQNYMCNFRFYKFWYLSRPDANLLRDNISFARTHTHIFKFNIIHICIRWCVRTANTLSTMWDYVCQISRATIVNKRFSLPRFSYFEYLCTHANARRPWHFLYRWHHTWREFSCYIVCVKKKKTDYNFWVNIILSHPNVITRNTFSRSTTHVNVL